MTTWKLLLVLGLAVGATRCSDLEIHDQKPDIVCVVNIYPDISDAILDKLAVCDFIIVSNDGLCDFAKHLKNYSDAKRVALIRGKAPHAKILRKVEVKFDDHFDPNHAVQNVQGSLAAGLFHGVELAFDSAHLDQHGQIKYAQFLKLLKRHLDDHVLISNSFVCQHHLPAFLLNAMSEVLDYVILVPSSQNASAEGNALAPRVYSDSVANCLLNANFPRNKIVLGLPTGGLLVDSSADRESPSNFIPYGNVCELQNEQQRHCEEQQYQNCSLFEDGVKLVYDDTNSAGGRALQVVGCKLRGISIALSYDDPAGICVGSSFPLLGAVQNVFEHRSGVSGFRGCPCGTDESVEEEHETDSPCHSSEHHQSDSHESDDCCCNNDKPCDGCKLLNRLQGAVKTSEHVAGISKSVADKVLESLDRVVELVSYTMGQRPELLESDPVSPQPAPSPAPSSLLGSLLPLGLGALNTQLPLAPSPTNVPAVVAAPTSIFSPLSPSTTGLIPLVLSALNQTLQQVLGSLSTSSLLGSGVGSLNLPTSSAPVPTSLANTILSSVAGSLTNPALAGSVAEPGLVPLVLDALNQTLIQVLGTLPGTSSPSLLGAVKSPVSSAPVPTSLANNILTSVAGSLTNPAITGSVAEPGLVPMVLSALNQTLQQVLGSLPGAVKSPAPSAPLPTPLVNSIVSSVAGSLTNPTLLGSAAAPSIVPTVPANPLSILSPATNAVLGTSLPILSGTGLSSLDASSTILGPLASSSPVPIPVLGSLTSNLLGSLTNTALTGSSLAGVPSASSVLGSNPIVPLTLQNPTPIGRLPNFQLLRKRSTNLHEDNVSLKHNKQAGNEHHSEKGVKREKGSRSSDGSKSKN